MRKRTSDPAEFGRVAVLMGGWVSGAVSRALLAGAANARPWMAGPGYPVTTEVAPGMAIARLRDA